MRKRVYVLVLFMLAVLLLIPLEGCQEKTLKVGLIPDEEVLPVYVAQAEGIFEQQRVKVELVQFQSAAERDAAIQSGAIDGAEGDLIAVALMRKGGTPVKAVSIALGANPSEGRFALLAAPHTFTSVTGIKNKTMAISKNTIIEFAADGMLKAKGIDPKQVEKVYVPKMPLRLEMLLNKQVASAVLPDPLASLAERKGAPVLIDDTRLGINLTQSVFFFREDALKEKKPEIHKFLLAFQQAAQRVTQNPDKYRSLFNQKVHVPKELQKDFPLPKFSPLQLPTRENVELINSWMKEKGLLQKSYSYQELIASDLIK